MTTTPDDTPDTPTGDRDSLFPFPPQDPVLPERSVDGRDTTAQLDPPASPPAASRHPWDAPTTEQPPLAPPAPFAPPSTWPSPRPTPPAPPAPPGLRAPTSPSGTPAPQGSATWPVPPAPAAPPVTATPSVAAPAGTGTTTSLDPQVRTPRWVVPLVVLACVGLFAGGALAGWAVAERGGDGEAVTAPQSPGTVAPAGGDAPVPSGVEEPVAAVAQAVAPSVVQIETNFGLGSGVVMDDEGNILTAAHVIEGATQLRVRLADGTVVPAEIVGTSPETDVGVVRVDPRPELVPAALGVGAEVQVGQLAVAVGSPFGLQQTVTSGIVSALDRPVETAPTFRVGMIQTDASINPGNSGGALADRHGRVIGINDAIRTQGGGNEGVGFAIPIDLAASVAERLIAGEPIRSGFLGVSANDAFEGRPGALVQEVTAGTPAADAGIEIGDLIVSVDGEPVRSVQQLRARILAIPPGTEVVVEVVRDGEIVAFDVVLASAVP